MLRAAIAGLGQVGLLFDQDPKRKGIWTHFSMYEWLHSEVDLVAVCDPDPERRALATRRRPGLRIYETLDDLLAAEPVDIVSLCTPPQLHAKQIKVCAGRAKVVLCEKPLAEDSVSGREAVAACYDAGTLLAVNYYKRFEGCVPAAKSLLDANQLGSVKLANATFCGPLEAVGSHMLDLLRYLFGEFTVSEVVISRDDRSAVLLRGAGGIVVHFHNLGPREEFLFELDAIGTRGRIRILNNCRDIEFFHYRDSDRYTGYRELFPEPVPTVPENERFLPLLMEAIGMLRGERVTMTSDGENALRSQNLIDEVASALRA